MTKHESQRAVHVLLVVKDTSLSVAFGRCVLWRVEHLDWGREAKENWKGSSEFTCQADMHRMSRKATGRFAHETFGPIEAQKRETEALSEVPPLETHTCKTSIANRTSLINQAVCLLRALRIFVWSKTCIFSSTDQMYAAL